MPMKMIEEPDADQLETWQNVTRGRVVLRRVGAMGQPRFEMIGGGRTFHITPQERRMNQEVCASEDLDFFLNGTLQPLNIPNAEEAEVLLNNPNLLGDISQIKRLFQANNDVFAERLSAIRNVSALERLKDIANEDDTGATVAQARMIDARLAQVAPVAENVNPNITGGTADGRERSIKAVTPR